MQICIVLDTHTKQHVLREAAALTALAKALSAASEQFPDDQLAEPLDLESAPRQEAAPDPEVATTDDDDEEAIKAAARSERAKKAAATRKANKEKEAAPADDTDEEEGESIRPTFLEVRTVVGKLATEKGRDVVKSLLDEYGAEKISAVKEASWSELMFKAEALLSG